MEQNRNTQDTEVFDSSSRTEIFDPSKLKEAEVLADISVEDNYYDDEEDFEEEESSENEKSSALNGVLLAIVIILAILLVFTVIWGIPFFKKLNENNKELLPPPEKKETVVENGEKETADVIEEEEEIEETEAEKIEGEISFDVNTIEKSGKVYLIDAWISLGSKTIKRSVTIDEETEIKEDGNDFSHISFVDIRLKNDILFDAVVDRETLHVDSISYDSAIFEEENEEDGIVLEEEDEEGFVLE